MTHFDIWGRARFCYRFVERFYYYSAVQWAVLRLLSVRLSVRLFRVGFSCFKRFVKVSLYIECRSFFSGHSVQYAGYMLCVSRTWIIALYAVGLIVQMVHYNFCQRNCLMKVSGQIASTNRKFTLTSPFANPAAYSLPYGLTRRHMMSQGPSLWAIHTHTLMYSQ